MELHERIKEVRKHFNLSQDDFGKRLGLSRSVVANIELNRLAKPEAKEPILRLICSEFDINYDWLTTGSGCMIKSLSIEEELAGWAGSILNPNVSDDFKKEFVYMLSQLPETHWEVIKDMCIRMGKLNSKNENKKETV